MSQPSKITSHPSLFQVRSFLANYIPKTDRDEQFINSYIQQHFKNPSEWPQNGPIIDFEGLDVHSFIYWLERGERAFKVAKHKNDIILLGNCTLSSCEILAALLPSGPLNLHPSKSSVPPSELTEATDEEKIKMLEALYSSQKAPDFTNPLNLRLSPRYYPKHGDRVIFYDFTLEYRGVGILNYIDAEGYPVMFCYFSYPTQTSPLVVDYSLEGKLPFKAHSLVFENINPENISTTLGNSTSLYRRLGKELEKCGKVWKDKRLRIEPLNLRVPLGERYAYIADDFSVKEAVDNGSRTALNRYRAGNYFRSRKLANEMASKMSLLLDEYLASENWPEID